MVIAFSWLAFPCTRSSFLSCLWFFAFLISWIELPRGSIHASTHSSAWKQHMGNRRSPPSWGKEQLIRARKALSFPAVCWSSQDAWKAHERGGWAVSYDPICIQNIKWKSTGSKLSLRVPNPTNDVLCGKERHTQPSQLKEWQAISGVNPLLSLLLAYFSRYPKFAAIWWNFSPVFMWREKVRDAWSKLNVACCGRVELRRGVSRPREWEVKFPKVAIHCITMHAGWLVNWVRLLVVCVKAVAFSESPDNNEAE